MSSELSEQVRQQINAALFAGNKIEAIKIYREAAGCGLAVARDFILALDAALRNETPDAFQHETKAGCGVAALLLLGLPMIVELWGWLLT